MQHINAALWWDSEDSNHPPSSHRIVDFEVEGDHVSIDWEDGQVDVVDARYLPDRDYDLAADRCEADHIDGGVCRSVLLRNGTCPYAVNHR